MITRVEISEGVTDIGPTVFYQHTLLRSIVIPCSVTSIGHWAFQGCKRLEEVCAPGVESVGVCAFQGCTSLKRVELNASGGDGTTVISSEAFSGCSELESVSMRMSVAFGQSCFRDCGKLDGLDYVTPDLDR